MPVYCPAWKTDLSCLSLESVFPLRQTYEMWFWTILIMSTWCLSWVSVCRWVCTSVCISLLLYAHIQEFSHKLAGLCSGPSAAWPFQPAPGCASLSSNSTPQPQCFCSPPPIQSPGSAPTPHSLQIASPSHLSQPIINYWWMGRLTELRDGKGRERRGKSWPGGENRRWGELSRATSVTLTNWYTSMIQWWRVQTCSFSLKIINEKTPKVRINRYRIITDVEMHHLRVLS